MTSVALLHFHNGKYQWYSSISVGTLFFLIKKVSRLCNPRSNGHDARGQPCQADLRQRRHPCGRAFTRLHSSRTHCHFPVANCSWVFSPTFAQTWGCGTAAKYQVVARVPKLSDTPPGVLLQKWPRHFFFPTPRH